LELVGQPGKVTGTFTVAHFNIFSCAQHTDPLDPGLATATNSSFFFVLVLLFYVATVDFCAAEGFCKAELLGNAHLVSIESSQENDFIEHLLYTQNMEFENRPVWIGGHKVDDSWKWSDGAEFVHTNWIEGEPDEQKDFLHQAIKNEHCAQFSHSRVGNGFARNKHTSKIDLGNVGEWNNADCQMKRGWICEYCTDQF
jgi:hypothetical protein